MRPQHYRVLGEGFEIPAIVTEAVAVSLYPIRRTNKTNYALVGLHSLHFGVLAPA